MKKIKWLSLVCAAFAVVMVLAGCTGVPADKINADTDPSDIVSQKVTESEWKAAFEGTNFNNFSYKFSISEMRNKEEIHIETTCTEGKVNGKNEYQKMTYIVDGTEYESEENYAGEVDGRYYIYYYSESEETWWRSESEYYGNNTDVSDYLLFKDSYSSLTYDNKEKAYVADTVELFDGEVTAKNVVLKFVEGKISYIKFDIETLGNTDSVSVNEPVVLKTTTLDLRFFAYGNTSFSLPEVAEEENKGNNNGNPDEPGIIVEPGNQDEPSAAFQQ